MPPGRVPAPVARWWVVLTDHQTGGRGRLGRVWEVPDRASVAVSCAIPVSDPAVAGWLPLLAGLALARALRQVTRAAGRELDPRLKWPNDVLLGDDGDRKVSGILAELVAVPTAPRGSPRASVPARDAASRAVAGDTAYVVVVGTGVNVDQTRDELPVDTATSLALAGARVRREDVVVSYLRELAALLPVVDGVSDAERGFVGDGRRRGPRGLRGRLLHRGSPRARAPAGRRRRSRARPSTSTATAGSSWPRRRAGAPSPRATSCTCGDPDLPVMRCAGRLA